MAFRGRLFSVAASAFVADQVAKWIVAAAIALGEDVQIAGSVGLTRAHRPRLGYVTDYLGLPHWPSFNLADVFVAAGVAVLLAAHRRATP